MYTSLSLSNGWSNSEDDSRSRTDGWDHAECHNGDVISPTKSVGDERWSDEPSGQGAPEDLSFQCID